MEAAWPQRQRDPLLVVVGALRDPVPYGVEHSYSNPGSLPVKLVLLEVPNRPITARRSTTIARLVLAPAHPCRWSLRQPFDSAGPTLLRALISP